MDDTLQELENELKRLRPRAPSASLLARIEGVVQGQARYVEFAYARAACPG